MKNNEVTIKDGKLIGDIYDFPHEFMEIIRNNIVLDGSNWLKPF